MPTSRKYTKFIPPRTNRSPPPHTHPMCVCQDLIPLLVHLVFPRSQQKNISNNKRFELQHSIIRKSCRRNQTEGGRKWGIWGARGDEQHPGVDVELFHNIFNNKRGRVISSNSFTMVSLVDKYSVQGIYFSLDNLNPRQTMRGRRRTRMLIRMNRWWRGFYVVSMENWQPGDKPLTSRGNFESL